MKEIERGRIFFHFGPRARVPVEHDHKRKLFIVVDLGTRGIHDSSARNTANSEGDVLASRLPGAHI